MYNLLCCSSTRVYPTSYPWDGCGLPGKIWNGKNCSICPCHIAATGGSRWPGNARIIYLYSYPLSTTTILQSWTVYNLNLSSVGSISCMCSTVLFLTVILFFRNQFIIWCILANRLDWPLCSHTVWSYALIKQSSPFPGVCVGPVPYSRAGFSDQQRIRAFQQVHEQPKDRGVLWGDADQERWRSLEGKLPAHRSGDSGQTVSPG